MSIGDKQNFLKHVETEISKQLNAVATADILGIISSALSPYSMERVATDKYDGDDFLKAFLDSKRIEGRSEKTLNHYDYVITRMLNVVGIPTAEITVYHLRSYLMQMRNNGISDRTLEGFRCVFSSFFGWLKKEKLIADNPCDNLGSIKHIKKLRLPFTDVEIEKLKENCHTDRDKALFSFLLSTGCRISEVCNIDIKDVDFQTMECTVLGKGNKERTVFMDDIAAMHLKKYLEGRTDDSPALFIGKGTDRMTPGGVRFRLNTIAKNANVENVHPHRFRRTLATNLIDRGMPIQEVASILGHENINTTMTYVCINKSNVKNAYRKYV